jgi:hypothetical protein
VTSLKGYKFRLNGRVVSVWFFVFLRNRRGKAPTDYNTLIKEKQIQV